MVPQRPVSRVLRPLVLVLAFTTVAISAHAQQTGAINGKVTATDGSVVPGVTVEARSNVLPGPRVTVTEGDGTYQLPALPPGSYTLTFTLAGMQTVTKKADVQLAETTTADTALSVQGVTESVTVTAEASLIDKSSAAITSGVSGNEINSLPVGTEYRDVIKLIPGVQYTQESVRGPSAGSSGQDNVYKFDGVNVSLPLFGTLSAEPASYDIAQVTIIKGGAKAVDFDRAGGFAIDSVSRSGTNQLSGQASFRFQNPSMAAKLNSGSLSQYDQTRDWSVLSAGGPILPSRLFFYGSYYRPNVSRNNQANVYGPLPKFDSTRNEGFGKVTYTPIHNALINLSYRDSHRIDTGSQFGGTSSSTTGAGAESRQKIGAADGSWILNSMSYLTFKATHFGLETQGRPDNVANATISTDIGSHLDVNNLDKLGLLSVPKPITGQNSFNAFVQPIIMRYGYLSSGVPTGGGTVGFATTFDKDNFFRTGGEVGYNLTATALGMRHNLHAGYQRYVDSEDLTRSSNGLGSITVPGGQVSFNGTPIFYETTFQQQGFGTVPPVIHSEYHSQSIEVNDTINWRNWTFNVGMLDSNDTLYGQGLKEDPSALSGYDMSTATTTSGRKYKMYDIPFSKMIQPRISATWAYNGKDTIFASYAKYNPAASSLPRAASWDRNLENTINAYYDASGNLFAVDPVKSSSGKLFVPNLTPPTHNEFLVGTAKQFNSQWSGRLYARYNKGTHYWEDTNNNARVVFNPPPNIPQTLYIPNLAADLAQIGSGSTYVITELDGAFTRYTELTAESEWRSSRGHFVRGSYTWSHYYGNFDQDDSTGGVNDMNTFIGSSNIGDGAGRQLWNNKLGTLRGDRPHAFKIYGAYFLPWNGSVGAYAIAQSGQPWEAMSYEPYKALTTSTSDSDRYAEPAGSRRSPGHAQLDLNYTQNYRFMKRYVAVIGADLFNVFDSQTGYNYDPNVHSATFGTPRTYFDPRRVEMTVRFQF